MIRLVDEATETIHHLAVCLDLDDPDTRLLLAYERALERGVVVSISTSSCVYQNNLSRLGELSYPNLHLYEDIVVEEITNPFLVIAKKICSPKASAAIRGQHIRFISNEREMLLNGGNAGGAYTGNTKNHSDIMYETGLLVNLSTHTINPGSINPGSINRLFNAICDHTLHSVSPEELPLNMTVRGAQLHQWIIDGIDTSEQNIYFENQYFISGEYDGSIPGTDFVSINQISNALIRRIQRAVDIRDPHFKFTMVNNLHCIDETSIARMTFHCTYIESIDYIRRNVICDDEIFDKYVEFRVPAENTLIHSKLFIFDESEAIMTSANIIDRSFSDLLGDYELSFKVDLSAQYHQIRAATPPTIRYRPIQGSDPYKYPIDVITERTAMETILYIGSLIGVDPTRIAGLVLPF
jgi:hypothetical protein